MIDRNKQFHPFFCRVGIISDRITGQASFYFTFHCLCSGDTDEILFAVVGKQIDIVVILKGNTSKVCRISQLYHRHADAVLLVIVIYVIAVLRFKVSDVDAVVVVLEYLLDVDCYGDQLVGTVPVHVADDAQKRANSVDHGVCVCV